MKSRVPEKILLPNEASTIKFGTEIAKTLEIGDIVALNGALGAGKTFLAGAIINYFYPQLVVTSPTFNLVNLYSDSATTMYHYDLYRLKVADEVFNLGIEESFSLGISIIEWPDIAKELMPKNKILDIKIDFDNDDIRYAIFSDQRSKI